MFSHACVCERVPNYVCVLNDGDLTCLCVWNDGDLTCLCVWNDGDLTCLCVE